MPAFRPYQPRAEAIWPAEAPQREHTISAPQVRLTYRCPRGHEFEVPFLDDIEVEWPGTWSCRRHGIEECPRTGGGELRKASASSVYDHPGRRRGPMKDGDHWSRLLQRRSIPELEQLLAERLRYLASCRRAGVRPTPAPRGSAPLSNSR